jgi:hypothetical protein
VLQMPMAQRRRVLGQRGRGVQGRERVGRALLLQQHGDQVEPGAGILRRAGEALAQQHLGRLDLAADVHERAQIRGRRSMAGGAEQRLAHPRLGVLDVALPVARDAVIDPGVRPTRCQLKSGGERALGVGVIAQRRPGLPVSVVRLRPVRRVVAGIARGLERRQRIGCAWNIRMTRGIYLKRCHAAILGEAQHSVSNRQVRRSILQRERSATQSKKGFSCTCPHWPPRPRRYIRLGLPRSQQLRECDFLNNL